MDDLEAKLLSLTEKRKPGRVSRKRKNVEEEESEDDQPELSALQKEMAAAERYEQQKDEQARSRILRQASNQKEKEDAPSREMRKRGSTKSSKDDQMNELRKRRAGAKSERDLRRSRDYMDEDDEDKDEDEDYQKEEEEEEKGSSDRKRERKSLVPSLTAADMNSIRLKRDSLDKWVNEAYFDDLVKGFFVKVGMGISNGKRVYRVALIDEVKEEKKRYKVVKSETGKVLVLKYGSGTKNFRMEFVSNQDFTQAEVDKWLQVMTESDEPILSVYEIKDKAAALKEFLDNYRYTNEDVNKILEQKRKLKQIHRNLASEKITLCSIRDAMQENGEAESSSEKFQEVLERIQEVEREMEERKKTQQEGKRQIGDINKKNRGVNNSSMALAKEEESKFFAAHARRKTNPTFMFGASKKKAGEPEEDEDEKRAVDEKARRLLKNSIDDLDLLSKDDITSKPSTFSVNGLDLDFDFDIDVSNLGRAKEEEPLAPVTLAARWVPSTPARPLRTLSVQEYKRRRGILN